MSDPTSIHIDDVKKALRGLGIDTTEIQSVTIGPDKVTVVRFRLDDNGHRFGAGDKIATTTTTIGIAGRSA